MLIGHQRGDRSSTSQQLVHLGRITCIRFSRGKVGPFSRFDVDNTAG